VSSKKKGQQEAERVKSPRASYGRSAIAGLSAARVWLGWGGHCAVDGLHVWKVGCAHTTATGL